jgi:hypothetical protein
MASRCWGAVVILIAASFAGRWAGRVTDHWLAEKQFGPPIRTLAARLVWAVTMLLGLVMALDRFGFEIAPVFRRLMETASLPDAAVTALGQRRGEAAARALKESAGPAAPRVEVGDTEAAERAERNLVPTRLELGAVGS